MTDVEFLEPDGSDGSDGSAPANEPVAPRRSLRAVATALALAGGALAVAAPFTSAYRLQLPGFAGGDLALDGWGRYDKLRTFAPVGQHGPRLGVLFCLAAAAVLVGVALWQVGGPRVRRAGSGAVLLAAGLTAATAASSLLDALATADSYQVVLRDNRPTNYESLEQPGVSLTPGPMLWCGAAATVLFVAAVVVRARTAAETEAAGPAAVTGELDADPAPPHRDDELLA